MIGSVGSNARWGTGEGARPLQVSASRAASAAAEGACRLTEALDARERRARVSPRLPRVLLGRVLVVGVDRPREVRVLDGARVLVGPVRLDPARGAVRQVDRRGRPRDGLRGAVEAWWIEPHTRTLTRARDAGIDASSAATGIASALVTLAPLYTKTRGRELVPGFPAVGAAVANEGSVFLLPDEAFEVDWLYHACEPYLQDALDLLVGCECRRGCPSCTGRHLDSRAVSRSAIPDRSDAAAFLRRMLHDPERSVSRSAHRSIEPAAPRARRSAH